MILGSAVATRGCTCSATGLMVRVTHMIPEHGVSSQDIASPHNQCYSLHLLVISVCTYGYLLLSHSFILQS